MDAAYVLLCGIDRWCSFQEARCGTKRKYPTREFVSFAEAARSYIELTRHDQLIHREIANAINGLTESLRLERKRVPGMCTPKRTQWNGHS